MPNPWQGGWASGEAQGDWEGMAQTGEEGAQSGGPHEWISWVLAEGAAPTDWAKMHCTTAKPGHTTMFHTSCSA